MGGDSFEGTEKLTNEEYETLVPEILQILSGLYIRAQPYIPLPEKNIHGDIDFLMILKPGVMPKTLVDQLKIDRYHLNNNETINSVYKNKQVDFCFKKSQEDFEMAKFYKSYSGVGAHLGLFLPSKEVKLSDTGLYALAYREHIKFQFLLTNSIEEILRFYGLDYKRYQQGFKTRKDLFEYLRNCCFTNEQKMLTHEAKNQSKITKFFVEYLKEQTNIKENNLVVFKQPLKDTLNYFKKQDEFKTGFAALIGQFDRKQRLNKKFNATHLMDYFKVKPKEVNKMKEKFQAGFKDKEQYLNYVEATSLQQILVRFSEALNISPPSQNQKSQEKPLEEISSTSEKKQQ